VAATLADLQVLWGGRDRLLRVAEVAEHSAYSMRPSTGSASAARLPYVWLVNSMRIRPRDLEEFVAFRVTSPRTAVRTGGRNRPEQCSRRAPTGLSRHAAPVTEPGSRLVEGRLVYLYSSYAQGSGSPRSATARHRHRPPDSGHAGLDKGDEVSLRIDKGKLIIERADESVTRGKRRGTSSRRLGRACTVTIGSTLRKLARVSSSGWCNATVYDFAIAASCPTSGL